MASQIEKILIDILDGKFKQYRRNCPENLTDLVFLEIEENYMNVYESYIKIKGKDTANKFIGKFIRKYWDLKNLGRCNSPSSRLIDSYEKHTN
ncbi:MAG: hypothetical protein FMNOHCHN_03187 [Ignavibacteriaceae bacterium]|nr:hypothetical protein [Ignavibacteriaceae bacterium]